ncbi:MAG: IclR family transcriptional regulator [Desulfobacter sp.]|nr:MAG: IclR family transcriptional regulator [Desulfobacter sp.]
MTAPKKFNAIEKALEILLKFEGNKPCWGTRELSKESGFSPATVQRILKVLKSYEFIRQDPKTRQYRIGNIFYPFVETLNASNNLAFTGHGFMETMTRQTGETAHLTVIEKNLGVCIDAIESHKMPMDNHSPLYAGASGKCLLAFSPKPFQEAYFKTVQMTRLTPNTILDHGRLIKEIEQIKSRGYALSLGERTLGLGALSAPVFGYKGDLLASLSLAIPEPRFRCKSHLAACIKCLIQEARAFSKAMGEK